MIRFSGTESCPANSDAASVSHWNLPPLGIEYDFNFVARPPLLPGSATTTYKSSASAWMSVTAPERSSHHDAWSPSASVLNARTFIFSVAGVIAKSSVRVG